MHIPSRLKSLELENFKSIKHRTRIDFSPITLFFGPNSAGKSSIGDALNLIKLFCFTGTQRTVSDVSSELKSKLKRWIGEGNSTCSLCVEIEVPIELNDSSGIFVEPEELVTLIKELDKNAYDNLINKIKLDNAIIYRIEVKMNLDKNSRALFVENSGITFVKLDIVDVFTLFNFDPENEDNKATSFNYVNKNQFKPQPFLLNEILGSEKYFNQPIQNSNSNIILQQLQQILISNIYYTLLPIEDKVRGNRQGYTEFNSTKEVDIDPSFDARYLAYKPVNLLFEDFASIKAYELMVELYKNKHGAKQIAQEDESVFVCYRRSKLFELVNSILNDELFLDSHYQIDGRCDFLIDKDEFLKIVEQPTLIGEQGLKGKVNLKLHAVIEEKLVELDFEDVGDGISYMLPIIIACGLNSFQNTLIEQPELHLHPLLQQAIADVIVRHGKNAATTMIVETHSEHLILRMLRRLKESQDSESPDAFKKEDISVYYFDPTIKNGTYVSRQYVTDDGDFEMDWPRGFFNERYTDLN